VKKANTIRNKRDLISAFSLMEVLVVISTTFLLLGILIPSLSRSRELARQVICQGRLQQWGLAFEAYSSVNNGFYPHVDSRDRTGPDPNSLEGPEDFADYYYGWVDVLPISLDSKPWREYELYKKPGPDTFFQCPSAKIIKGANYRYPYERVGYFSYAMNSCLELDENCRPPCYPYNDPTCGTNDIPSFLNTSLIRHPTRVILLFDQLLDPNYGFDGNHLNRSAGEHCGAYPRDFSVRHRRNKQGLGGFILFCDYHIEWKKSVWKEHWPDDLEVPPRDDVNWFPYP
jgi:type II secretory pathway pseudopilin PulG